MTFQEKYNRVFRDAYNFMADHYPPQNTDTFWNAYVDDINKLTKSYTDDLFIRALIVAISKELESEVKK